MERPNILLIMSDQHNRNVLGCYGDQVVRTPHLDRLASAGARFTNVYCPAPLCVPSRMSFMSSRTPARNQVWNNGHMLSSGTPTWPDYLNLAGYATALIGRMHFIGPDQRHGFAQHMLGDLHARWDKIPRVSCGQTGASVRVAGTGTSAYAWYDGQVADCACNFLKSRARASGDKPFAAVVGFLQPHSPYVAPADLFEDYLARLPPPEPAGAVPEPVRRHRRAHQFENNISELQARHARAAYYAMCEQLDRLCGRILDELERSGLADNTLVVYCSDHGDMLGAHGCWFKSIYYEGSASVPLILRWPGRIMPGAAPGVLATLMDIGPTFCDAAGAQPMRDIDGRSLFELINPRRGAAGRAAICAELCAYAPPVPSRMIRFGDWKLWQTLYPDGAQTVMFNLRDDPGETRDLSGAREHAAMHDRLIGELHADWQPDIAASLSARQHADVVSLIQAYAGQDWEHGGLALRAPADVDNDVLLK